MRTPMLLVALGLSLFLPTTTADESPDKPFDCGTDTAHASPDFLSTISSLSNPSRSARAALLPRTSSDPITIDTVFHIVSSAASHSSITNSMPTDQLAALNAAYAPHAISFNLLNVTWTTNDAWATGAAADDAAMKAALRQGSYATLNIYFQTELAGGVLGRCTLPASLPDGAPPAQYASDGCNVHAATLPQGAMPGFNAGGTAVHESGHWLGLLHTFEGYSCDGPGDYIDDTPPESVATEGCPVDPVKSSCAGSAGGDPIHNYMDYSVDACYEGFSEGQVERMRGLWGVFRQGR